MVTVLKNRKGQTMVEWLMLMAVASLTALLILTGPLSSFTSDLVSNIKRYTTNIVLNGETDQNAPSPKNPKRFKPVHL